MFCTLSSFSDTSDGNGDASMRDHEQPPQKNEVREINLILNRDCLRMSVFVSCII